MIELSVIVPVYNTAPYVGKCIESILGQTMSKLELILIDDGSTDGSAAVLDEYAAKDPRVRVVHKENGGVSVARNLALSMAQGEFIGFVDSDDYIAPQTYEVCIAAAREHNVPLVQFNFCHDVNGEIKQVHKRFNKAGLYPMPSSFRKYNSGWNSVVYKVVRRDFLASNQLEFFPWSYQSEDQSLSLLMFSYLDAFWCVEDVFYFRVSRGDSALHTINTEGYRNRVRTFKVLEEELEKRSRGKAYIRMARKFGRQNAFKARFKSLRLNKRRI